MFPRSRLTNVNSNRVTLDRLVHVPMNRTTSLAVARVLDLFQNAPASGTRSLSRTHPKPPRPMRDNNRR